MGKMSVHPSVRPSVRPYVRPYVHNKTQCSYKQIGDTGKSRLAIHDDITLKFIPSQGEGHRAPKYAKMAYLKVSPPPLFEVD